MTVQFDRSGLNLVNPQRLDDEPINVNTIMFHEFVVVVDLFESEALFVTFGEYVDGSLTPEALTRPLETSKRLNATGRYEYVVKIPSMMFLSTTTKAASVAIMRPSATNPESPFFQITSSVFSFTPSASLAGLDYEGIENSSAANLLAQIYENRTGIDILNAGLHDLEKTLLDEIENRTEADTQIREDLGAELENEKLLRQLAHTQMRDDFQAAINAEAGQRVAADEQLTSSLAEETAARELADSTERAERIAADEAETAARIAADNELQRRIEAHEGVGGALTAHNFGVATPSQNALTQYALSQIPSANSATDLWNATHVTNLFDNDVWQLNNTPNTNPPVFEWVDIGNAFVPQATNETLGTVKGSDTVNVDLEGSLYTNPAMIGAPTVEDLSNEEASRIEADAALANGLDAETAARIAADEQLTSSLAEETAARELADSTERAERIAADEAETAARIAADNAERADRIAAIDTERAERIAADELYAKYIGFEMSQLREFFAAMVNVVGAPVTWAQLATKGRTWGQIAALQITWAQLAINGNQIL